MLIVVVYGKRHIAVIFGSIRGRRGFARVGSMVLDLDDKTSIIEAGARST